MDFDALGERLDEYKCFRTAILCICDMHALEVLEYCKARGLRVPQDVGLMGFDNMPMLKYISPRIASVGYNVEDMATRAFDMLLNMIEGRPTDQIETCLDFTLEKGESL